MTHTTSRAAWGVDGCKAGWFYFKLARSGEPEYDRVDTLTEVVERANAEDLILVDIPIGLPKATDCHSAFRKCDGEARELLGYPRMLSVFPVPVRTVAETLRNERSSTSNDAKKARSLLARKRPVAKGRGISNQSLAILDKICEADTLVRRIGDSGPEATVRETHPEVCFWALNGKNNGEKKPMSSSKKKAEGKSERRKVLRDCWPASVEAIDRALADRRFLRREVAEDDMLDAMACALVATAPEAGLKMLPEAGGEWDMSHGERRLPMEIVYAEQDAILWGATVEVG